MKLPIPLTQKRVICFECIHKLKEDLRYDFSYFIPIRNVPALHQFFNQLQYWRDEEMSTRLRSKELLDSTDGGFLTKEFIVSKAIQKSVFESRIEECEETQVRLSVCIADHLEAYLLDALHDTFLK